MIGTYATLLILLAASALVGQAVFAVCGRRELSWLSPALGLGALSALAWGGASLGDDCGAVVAVAGATGLAVAVLGVLRPELTREELYCGALVIGGAVVLASLPFLVEGRFGILGTSLNPDMSQHLFAADRLASGGEERLIDQGYPLGPHSLVVAASALGPTLIEGFGGLTLAIAVASALAPLALLSDLPRARRIGAALLVAFAYMAASYLIQGAVKETMQAMLVLAFAICLHELTNAGVGTFSTHSAHKMPTRGGVLAGVPLAVVAVGAVYVYSFAGLAWLIGAAGLTALLAGPAAWRAAVAPTVAAVAVFAVAIAPEVSRMADFAEFETFDPDGPGLGNLFNPISPVEALGVWPSGDFRLDAGAGFAPTFAFWLGGLLAAAALGYGLWWWISRRELAVPAALTVGAALYAYAVVSGTPYQEAKAMVIASPLAMLVAVRATFAPEVGRAIDTSSRDDAKGLPSLPGLLGAAFGFAAAACSVLALANGPVGPASWTPELIELRESGELGAGGPEGDDTLVLLARDELAGKRGEDLALWELRGGRVCAGAIEDEAAKRPGIEHYVYYRDGEVVQTTTTGSRPGAAADEEECPFIADGARADPGSS